MIFLVEYDRHAGKLISMRTFESSDRKVASQSRLELEISLMSQGLSREVVLLEAASEAALRETHGRYFRGIKQMGGELDLSSRRQHSTPDFEN